MRGAARLTPKHETLQGALAAAAQGASGLTFVDLQEHEKFVSYREFYHRARQAAAFLEKEGVRPGDRVALILSTSPGFVDAILAPCWQGRFPSRSILHFALENSTITTRQRLEC